VDDLWTPVVGELFRSVSKTGDHPIGTVLGQSIEYQRETSKGFFMKNFKSFLCIAAIVLSSLAVVSFARAAEAPGEPVAHFPETAYTFPSTLSGEKISHAYQVYNKGTGTLVIHNVHTS
jgi:hypothetical protein